MADTVAGAFAETAARHADRPFLHVLEETAGYYGMAGGTLTYGEAATEMAVLTARYAEAGYGPGHRIGLMLENRPDFFLHWIALNGLGVSVVPLNPDLRPAELDYLVQHSEIVLAVGMAAFVPRLQAAADRTGSAMDVVMPDSTDLPAPPRPAAPAALGPSSECALLYTSGTTGTPKGCVLSNAYFLRCGAWYAGIGGLCEVRPGQERLLTPLPMVHMNAMACSTMAMIVTGGCIIPLDRFHPRTWWANVRDAGATIVHYLGVMPSMLLGAEAADSDREHAVRFGFGAGVDRAHHAVFEARFGFPLLEAWAMTETGNGAVIIANREPRHVGTSCFGRPEADVEVALVDEQGAAVPVGVPGEMLVRAAGADPRTGFFSEYLKDPAATAEAWAGGWFHTGDIVRADAQGYLYFVDRRKNVIRRSGENIAAVEVESVLRRHAGLREVAVAATPDAVRGEEVLACVIAKEALDEEARRALAEALVALALDRLAYFKAPGYVAFVDAIPLTASQKVQRGELKKLAAELPGQAGCLDLRHLKKRQA